MPHRIAADASGYVYVSDSGNHIVLRIDPGGNAAVITGQLGSRGNYAGTSPGSAKRPAGMVVTSAVDLDVEVGDEGIMRLHAPASAVGHVPVTVATSGRAVETDVRQPWRTGPIEACRRVMPRWRVVSPWQPCA